MTKSGTTAGDASGTPPDISKESATVRAVEKAVTQLELHRNYMERDLQIARDDMRDVRDRLTRLETKVSDLPSKVWIGTVVIGGLVAMSAIVGLIMHFMPR